jgi:hypothetical protein
MRITTIAAAGALLFAATSAQALNFVEDNSSPINIPGLAGFQTTGNDMGGLVVTATFGTIGADTAIWQALGGTSGQAVGNGWSLRVDVDTFSVDAWEFTYDFDTTGRLLSLELDGDGNLTVFDRTDPDPGTNGSASGRDWASGDFDTTDTVVTYSVPVGIGGNAPVGDLFQNVLIEFNVDLSNLQSFLFSQDADNDSRILLPAPASLSLLGFGLIGLAAIRRRRAA